MQGFLYYHFRILRTSIMFFCIFCLPITILIPIGRALLWNSIELENITEYDFPCMTAYMLIMIFSYFFQGLLNKTDQLRLPVYFAIASSAGVNGYLKAKYTACFLLGFIAMNICIVTDLIASTIIDVRTALVPTSFTALCTTAFLATLLLNAIEIPFIVRFGYKKGIILKATFFLLLLISIGMYFLFGDISMFGSMEDFIQFLIDIISGKRGGTVLIALSALSPIVIGMLYILSYKLSCKLFLKGVEQLEE